MRESRCLSGQPKGSDAQCVSFLNRRRRARNALPCPADVGPDRKGLTAMSFQVVRHEHPDIFVINRQTYETYRFTVGDDGGLAHDGAPSDLGEARRTAIAFLSQSQKERAPHR